MEHKHDKIELVVGRKTNKEQRACLISKTTTAAKVAGIRHHVADQKPPKGSAEEARSEAHPEFALLSRLLIPIPRWRRRRRVHIALWRRRRVAPIGRRIGVLSRRRWRRVYCCRWWWVTCWVPTRRSRRISYRGRNSNLGFVGGARPRLGRVGRDCRRRRRRRRRLLFLAVDQIAKLVREVQFAFGLPGRCPHLKLSDSNFQYESKIRFTVFLTQINHIDKTIRFGFMSVLT